MGEASGGSWAKEESKAKPARMGRPKAFFGIGARPRGLLVGLWRGGFHQVDEHFVESWEIEIDLDFDLLGTELGIVFFYPG